MQSGSALNPWAYKTHDNLRAVAKFLKISSDNEEELLQNLQQIPTKEIFEAQEHLINVRVRFKKYYFYYHKILDFKRFSIK